MGKVTSSTSILLSGGVDSKTSAPVSQREVERRLHYLAALVQQRAQTTVDTHWDAADLQQLASGKDFTGATLPSKGHTALSRLRWDAQDTPGLYLPERVKRLGREAAARALRQAATNGRVVEAILRTWPKKPRKRTPKEWQNLWDEVPNGTSRAEIRNRTRAVQAYLAKAGVLPKSIVDLVDPPRISNQLLFAAADKQLVEAESIGGKYRLTLKLPTKAIPSGRGDWSRITFNRQLPDHVDDSSEVSTPTVRFAKGKVYADIAIKVDAPAPAKNHKRAIGLDWGVTDLATAAKARVTGRGTIRVAAGHDTFSAHVNSRRQHALRRQGERLWTKVAHHHLLLQGKPDNRLDCKKEILVQELRRIGHKRQRINDNTAKHFARWAVDLALQHRATAIYVEDLATLEAGGLGKAVNVRVSSQLRGQAFDALRHAASKVGIEVVTVPARYTSSTCSTCLGPIKHPVHKESTCKHCGVRMDRDHMAAERIVSRGLAGQSFTSRPKNRPPSIKKSVDKNVVRDKTGPTPKRRIRPRYKRGRIINPAAGYTAQRLAGQCPRSKHQVLNHVHTLSPFVGAITWKAGYPQLSPVLQV